MKITHDRYLSLSSPKDIQSSYVSRKKELEGLVSTRIFYHGLSPVTFFTHTAYRNFNEDPFGTFSVIFNFARLLYVLQNSLHFETLKVALIRF